MKNLKDYLNDSIEPYIEKNGSSVYAEEKRPKNEVRIWLSYDAEDGADETYRKLYNLFDELGAESWGNSVATFLVEIPNAPTNSTIAEILVNMLQEKDILDGNDFEDESWKGTQGLSIYVIYRFYYHDTTKENPKVFNSDHFVLLHNAPMKHLNGWAS